ncbi:MAG: DUF3473 domain-containing protein [Theionarchaea archaeon]|nr:MAG: hypothetical protein AYK18_12185 [Theionarchaea archaeon DG-70]MBU7009629.1 DUF3473 domain-containing protein [Theionarchaea archaeon]
MQVCVTADIERFSDGVAKYDCSYRINDIVFIRKLTDMFCEVDILSTLFILGKFAYEEPAIIDIVKENGHELASHGYSHFDLRTLPFSLLKEELTKSKAFFSPKGFRAPYYGCNAQIIEQLKLHFVYDSSYVPMRTTLISHPIHMLTESLMEIPISTVWGLPLTSTTLRLLPLPIVKELVSVILKRNKYLIVNVHPWEFAKVPQEISVPFYVKKNTGLSFLNKFCELLQFLQALGGEFVTMEQIYEHHRGLC